MRIIPVIRGLLFASVAFTAAINFAQAETTAVNQRYEKAELQKALEIELEAIIAEADFPGVVASVVMPDGVILDVAAGYADVEKRAAMRSDHVMPAGSVGKTFTVATALQIVTERGLDLDTPLVRYIGERAWYQGMPNGDTITLRMLLNHTSGIAVSHIDHPTIFPLFKQTFGPEGQNMSDLGFENIDGAIALTDSTAQFPSGEGFAYSDANYILTGLFIEDICSCLIFDEVQKRFIEPLGMEATLPTPRTLDKYAAGYEREVDILPGSPKKLTTSGRLFYDPALEWTGGGIASNSRDLAHWAKALFSAEAISPELLNEMIQSASDVIPEELGWKYGLGVQIAHDSHGLRLMHGGYIPGYSTYIEYQPEPNMSLAFQINTRSGFGANRRIADRLWAVISNKAKELSK